LTVTTVGEELTVHVPLDTVTEYEPLWLTLIDWLIAPFDHVLPEALEDVNITEPPEQNVVGPLALIVGVVGTVFTVTVVGLEDAEQDPFDTVTEYEPFWLTVIDWLVAPFDQVLPEALEDVNVTEPPEQNVVAPPALIVGVVGAAVTITVVGLEDVVQDPFDTVTEYEPLWLTVIDCVVDPSDQVFPVALDEVNITEPPEQKVVGPLALIIDVVGIEFTVTVVGLDDVEHDPFDTVKEYEPLWFTVIDCVVAPFDQTFPVALDEVNVTEPPEQKVVAPLAFIIGVVGAVFTVTVVGLEEVEHNPFDTVTE